MRFLCAAGVIVVASAALQAQDAAKTLPENYRVELENEYVRVTRAHYGPYAKLPGHTHTSLPSAYVYLNDSGPVAFKHIGLEYGAVTRPATVARSFRLYRGLEEIHEVENLSATPSEFLRVEFKTDPVDARTLRGKFLPPSGQVPPHRVEFENAQLRVTRVSASVGQAVALAASPHPSVLISLTEDEMGQARWLAKGRAVSLRPPVQPFEALRFELKTGVKTTY